MSQADTPDGHENPQPDSEIKSWVEENRQELERIADGDYASSWVAEGVLQSFDDEEEDEPDEGDCDA